MGEGGARPSLRDEQRTLTRRRLLDAAEQVFAERGYHGASVDEIARRAGATSGALYSNFASKEELFLALFDTWLEVDLGDYGKAVAGQPSMEAQARAGADRWMQVLRERPTYFPLLVEFWLSAVRRPDLRRRLADHFSVLRRGIGALAAAAMADRGMPIGDEDAERLGLLFSALGNGLALEKLVDPEAVPDTLYADLLGLVVCGIEALLSALESGGG